MHRRPPSRSALIAVLMVFGLVAAACGQKADVANVAAGDGLGGGSGGEFDFDDGTGAGTGDAVEGGAVDLDGDGAPDPVTGGTGGPGGATGGGGTAGGGDDPAAAPGAGGGGGDSAPAAAGDRTGITDKEIVIGIHAPLTGAAPVPQDSVEKAKDLYWKFLAERGGIFGRNVRVVFRDDQFNPSRAVAVCREMVEQEHAFLLVGIGTDQVVSCARYASQAGIPYFSMGGGEAAVAGLRNYFGISMSLPQQGPLLAQMVKKTGKTKVGVVTINTPNYDDTFNSLVQSAKAAGLSVVRADRISKQPSQSEALAEANNLRTSGAEAVLIAHTPVAFLNLAHAAQGQAYTPLWAGPGMTSGLNLVAEFGCPSIAGARFLSPFPQLDVIDRFDADYKPAYRKYNNGEEADDLGLVVWGLEKTLHQFLKAAGPDLGRARLIATIESGQEFVSNVFPPSRFGPGQRFGASQANLLEADCANRRYRTLATFTSSF